MKILKKNLVILIISLLLTTNLRCQNKLNFQNKKNIETTKKNLNLLVKKFLLFTLRTARRTIFLKQPNYTPPILTNIGDIVCVNYNGWSDLKTKLKNITIENKEQFLIFTTLLILSFLIAKLHSFAYAL